VVAVVSPAPAKTPTVAVAVPSTTKTEAKSLVANAASVNVNWGNYDPAGSRDGGALFSDLVSNHYEQLLLQSNAGAYSVERQQGALAGLPEQRDVGFILGSYDAQVSDASTGATMVASIDNARLSVSSTRNTYDTGFTLVSPVYTGQVNSTGTFSSSTGTLMDDGSHPQTRLHGVVGSMNDGSVGASYGFSHQIDPQLSAGGTLNWMANTPSAPAQTAPPPAIPD
jgi:hypothetical protein